MRTLIEWGVAMVEERGDTHHVTLARRGRIPEDVAEGIMKHARYYLRHHLS